MSGYMLIRNFFLEIEFEIKGLKGVRDKELKLIQRTNRGFEARG